MRTTVPDAAVSASPARQPAGPPGNPTWCDIRQFGAVGDGKTSCTSAIQQTIDHCASLGGGTVVVPGGKFVTGTIWLRSNITLHLESGAVLLGTRNVSEHPMWASKWEGPVRPTHAPLIAGEGLQNIAVSGRGTIDGQGKFWWNLFQTEMGADMRRDIRPNLLQVVDCRNVLIESVHIVNSSRWTLRPTACDNVTIARVTIHNPPDSPNTDGINPDSCSNVHISDCHIDVGDDCITLKSGAEDDGRAEHRPCQNITIMNCTMLHGHGGVVIGSEMSGGVRNVAISNCVFSGTDRGIRLKSRRGRGSVIEDLRVDNIVMDNVLCPIAVNMFYECGVRDASLVTDQSPKPVGPGTPQFRRLRFSNITATKVKYAAVFVLGLPEMSVEDVTIEGVSLYLDPTSTKGGSPVMAPGIPDMCRAGVCVRNARNVKLRSIDVQNQLGPAVVIDQSSDVHVSDLYARRDEQHPLIAVDGVAVTAAQESAAITNGVLGSVHGMRSGTAAANRARALVGVEVFADGGGVGGSLGGSLGDTAVVKPG